MECQWGYLTSPNKHSLIFAANRNTDQWCAELHDALSSSFTPKNISSEDCRVGSKTDGLFESFPFYFIPIQFPKGGFKEFKIHTLSKALRSHNVHTGNTNWTFLASLIKTATQLTTLMWITYQAGLYAIHFIFITNLVWLFVLLSPWNWSSGRLKRLNNLLKVSALVRSRAEIWTQGFPIPTFCTWAFKYTGSWPPSLNP